MSRTVCTLCGLELSHAFLLTRHSSGRRCKANQLAKTLFSHGLTPIEFRWQAKSDHAAEALRMFGFDVELHQTRGRKTHDDNASSRRGGTGIGAEAWTSEEGVALALTIEEIARLLALSYPEAARRLNEHRELIGQFGTAWRLGSAMVNSASTFEKYYDPTLIEILLPINYVLDSDGKRRPQRVQR
jgi:hypothetical protein